MIEQGQQRRRGPASQASCHKASAATRVAATVTTKITPRGEEADADGGSGLGELAVTSPMINVVDARFQTAQLR